MEKRNLTNKITYYLGAGASANSIPTVGGIKSRLEDFRLFINNCGNQIATQNYGSSEHENFNTFREFLSPILEVLPNVPSIDTLAKRLFDKEKSQEYQDYKIFLVVLFNYLHYFKSKKSKNPAYIENSLEGRYENLIRSINLLEGKSNTSKPIPSNFNFISWNYDFQLELTTYRDLKRSCH